MSRQPWDKTHERHVFWSEKGMSVVVFFAGMWMLAVHDHEGSRFWQMIGAVLVGVGIWGALPSVRPLLSMLIDRVPFLSKRDTPDIPPPKDEDE